MFYVELYEIRRFDMTIKLFNITINIKKETLAVIAVFAFMLLSLAVYIILENGDDVVIDAKDARDAVSTGSEGASTLAGNANADSDGDREIEGAGGDEIKVYVIGCVNNPGIITLKKGQMIYEAIEAAGGVTEEADTENINMVYELEENVMLNVLSKDRVLEDSKGYENKGYGNMAGGKAAEAGTGIQVINDEGDSVVYTGGRPGEGSSSEDSWKKVNINTASVAELDTLPGIGEITAESIIKYRQQHGKFERIEDIMNVPGIKEGKFEKIKGFITVE